MAALPDVISLLFVPGAAIAVLAGVVSTWVLRWFTTIGRPSGTSGPWEWLDDAFLLAKSGMHPDERDDWWQIGAALAGLGAVGAASAYIWQAVVLGPAAEASDWYALVAFLLFPAVVLTACFGWSKPGRPFSVATGLLITYLLALALALFVPALRTGALSLGPIAAAEAATGPLARSWSGALGFLAALFAVRASLSLVAGPGPAGAASTVGVTTALIAQCLRAGWLYVCILSLALLFGAGLSTGASGAVLLLAEYAFLLLVLAALYAVIRRWGAERILVLGALPSLALALVALALALGGL